MIINMLDIVIVACMLNKNVCEMIRLAEAIEGSTPAFCTISQPPAAKFLNEHPGWYIKKWWCIPSGSKDS